MLYQLGLHDPGLLEDLFVTYQLHDSHGGHLRWPEPERSAESEGDAENKNAKLCLPWFFLPEVRTSQQSSIAPRRIIHNWKAGHWHMLRNVDWISTSTTIPNRPVAIIAAAIRENFGPRTRS